MAKYKVGDRVKILIDGNVCESEVIGHDPLPPTVYRVLYGNCTYDRLPQNITPVDPSPMFQDSETVSFLHDGDMKKGVVYTSHISSLNGKSEYHYTIHWKERALYFW